MASPQGSNISLVSRSCYMEADSITLSVLLKYQDPLHVMFIVYVSDTHSKI